MVKKIKKYAKFIVCVALIMGLIAPSYAALSASDGSAFVTKAEFDSALADFNARLTTFEAGINSKIDSQVTSYLDRNGIWNGKLQTLHFDNTNLHQFNILDDFGLSTGWQVPSGSIYAGGWTDGVRTAVAVPSTWKNNGLDRYLRCLVLPGKCNTDWVTMIESVSKSGMLISDIYARTMCTYGDIFSVNNKMSGRGTIYRPVTSVSNCTSWMDQALRYMYNNQVNGVPTFPKDKLLTDLEAPDASLNNVGCFWGFLSADPIIFGFNPVVTLVLNVRKTDQNGQNSTLLYSSKLWEYMIAWNGGTASINLDYESSNNNPCNPPMKGSVNPMKGFVQKGQKVQYNLELFVDGRYCPNSLCLLSAVAKDAQCVARPIFECVDIKEAAVY